MLDIDYLPKKEYSFKPKDPELIPELDDWLCVLSYLLLPSAP